MPLSRASMLEGAFGTAGTAAMRARRRSWRNTESHDREESFAPRVLLLLLARMRRRTLSVLRRGAALRIAHRPLLLPDRHGRGGRGRPGVIILDDERTPRPSNDGIQPGHIAFR